ncbi:hypothetical protein [Sandaracinus amylolyticus]|uniref:hypothetical protein n=1 Tax=Sandaracinus amylolyticus TaxID=927083 RepID=UPI001F184A6A|nr:hypothetical protein [Sandaracinus amylolyticus]UJR81281.1 Hypothetical protein I5071_33380 [Sandaracinus amylolyticus]
MRSMLAMIVLLTGCTCGPQGGGTPVPHEAPAAHQETPSEAPAQPEFEDAAGGLAWRAEEPLISRRPSSPMRAAEYAVRDHEGAELTVFHFGRDQGGGVDENVARWVDQFEQPDGRPSREVAVIERAEVNGIRVTRVQVAGAFAGMRGMGGGGGAAQPGYRLLGAIAEGPDGMVFFKLTGPEAAVQDASGAFESLIASLHPSG